MVEITAFYEFQQRARRKTQPRDDFHLHVWNVLNTYRSTGSPTSLTSLLSIHKNGRKLWDMFSQPRSSLSCSFCPTNSPHVALLQLFWQIEQCGRWRTPPARNTSEVKPCITREMEAVISTFFFFFLFARVVYLHFLLDSLFFFFFFFLLPHSRMERVQLLVEGEKKKGGFDATKMAENIRRPPLKNMAWCDSNVALNNTATFCTIVKLWTYFWLAWNIHCCHFILATELLLHRQCEATQH